MQPPKRKYLPRNLNHHLMTPAKMKSQRKELQSVKKERHQMSRIPKKLK